MKIQPRHFAPFLFVAVSLSFGLSSGCERGGRDGSKVLKLGFVTNNASDFWKIAAAGVQKYEKEGGVQVDVKIPSNGTAAEQDQIIENLSSQGYDAIALSPVAPNDQIQLLNKIGEKTKLITFDSD